MNINENHYSDSRSVLFSKIHTKFLLKLTLASTNQVRLLELNIYSYQKCQILAAEGLVEKAVFNKRSTYFFLHLFCWHYTSSFPLVVIAFQTTELGFPEEWLWSPLSLRRSYSSPHSLLCSNCHLLKPLLPLGHFGPTI